MTVDCTSTAMCRMEGRRLVCEVSVFLKHLRDNIEVVWEEEFPVQVNTARDSLSRAIAWDLRTTVYPSQVSFSVAILSPDTSEAHIQPLSDDELITEEMLSSLRVDVSFPDGSLYGRAVNLRAFLLELSQCDITTTNGTSILLLPDINCPMFGFEEQSFIVVRDCYPVLFDLIMKRASPVRVALAGTPGIGKTCFLIYFLWRLLHSELQSSDNFPRVLFHDKERDRFVIHENGSVLPLIDQPGYAFAQRAHPDIWYLVDSVEPELTVYTNILLVAPPDRSLVKHHNKDAIPFATWYMPLWTEREIEDLIALRGDSPVIRLNQEKFGNIPRSLFTSQEDSLASLAKAWEEAVRSVTRQALTNAFFGSKKDTSIVHHVIHMEVPKWRNMNSNTGLPKNDFTTMYLKFASQMSQEAIITNLCENRPQDLQSFLESAPSASIAGNLCKKMFEAYAF